MYKGTALISHTKEANLILYYIFFTQYCDLNKVVAGMSRTHFQCHNSVTTAHAGVLTTLDLNYSVSLTE